MFPYERRHEILIYLASDDTVQKSYPFNAGFNMKIIVRNMQMQQTSTERELLINFQVKQSTFLRELFTHFPRLT